MPDNPNIKLNPRITNIVIGIRNLRRIKIYPLSMANQMELTDILIQGWSILAKQGDDMSDVDIMKSITNLIKDNLDKILEYIVDEDEKDVMEDVDNFQFTEIAERIYMANYEGSIKNVQGLFEKIKTQFQPRRPSPLSVSDTDIDLSTSTDSPTLKEGSQEISS